VINKNGDEKFTFLNNTGLTRALITAGNPAIYYLGPSY
jgi:hypothetical protein